MYRHKYVHTRKHTSETSKMAQGGQNFHLLGGHSGGQNLIFRFLGGASRGQNHQNSRFPKPLRCYRDGCSSYRDTSRKVLGFFLPKFHSQKVLLEKIIMFIACETKLCSPQAKFFWNFREKTRKRVFSYEILIAPSQGAIHLQGTRGRPRINNVNIM